MVLVDGYFRMRDHLSRHPIASRLLVPFRIPVVRKLIGRVDQTLRRWFPPPVSVRREFNSWAQKGLGERMEIDHMWVFNRTFPIMGLSSEDRILDLGCGDGWACRLIAERLGSPGRVVGMDISDEMIRRARIKSAEIENLAFLCGSAEQIPCGDAVFTKVLSVSAFYYFEQQEMVLKELFRVVVPEGQLFLLTCLYKDLPDWNSTVAGWRVPVHVCGADEYKRMLQAAGWRDVHTEELLKRSEPGSNNNRHDRALLISARR
jgi:SAM-dependent methyltransferase